MGKKSKRRGAKGGGAKKGAKPKKDSPRSVESLVQSVYGGGGGYGMLELMAQAQLMDRSRRFFHGGEGREWAYHDEWLKGAHGEFYEEDSEDEGELAAAQTGDAKGDDPEEGSPGALRAALDRAWSDPAVANPLGVGLAFGTKGEWMDWATEMAASPDRVALFRQSYDEDVALHRATLEKLSGEEERAVPHGGLDHVLALNCILMDTFDRLVIDPPPTPHLQQALSMRMSGGETLFDARRKVWKAYEDRTFKMMETVRDHPVIPTPKPAYSWKGQDSEVRPVEERGEFPRSATRCDGVEEEEGLYGGACGFTGDEVEELAMQGVMPWDDDAYDVMAVLNGDYD